MTTSPTIIDRDRLYIGGAWVEPSSGDVLEVVNPATEEVIGRVPEGTAADIDRAVEAAQAAFEVWSSWSLPDRVAFCSAVAARLQDRSQELAALMAQEVGSPLPFAMAAQAGLPAITFGSMERFVKEIAWEQRIGNSLVVKEPIGVVGAITPWNYPLHQIAAKVAPALVTGCTVVLKPSEVTPLNAFVLAEIIEEVSAETGAPAGIFNLVPGRGPVAGEALAAHPGVDMVSFTGSTAAGRRVGEVAAANITRVALELGGKSPNVILDDADLEKAVVDGIRKCYTNSGQTCSALTRMLVPRSSLPQVEAIAKAAAEATVVGDPFAQGTHLGPLVSKVQQDRVRGYIEKGLKEGARLVTGGAEQPAGLEHGYYVQPTVFSDVTPDMTIAQEEIFGPVLAIMPYDSEDEAVKIANHTVYGLAGGVWSGDEDRARQVARKLRTGQVEINGGVFNPLAPFGGYKRSGNGRELGPFGIEEFLVVKSLQL